MLSHSEFFGLKRDRTTFFSIVPADAVGLLRPYYFYNRDPNSDIAKALHLSAFGKLRELKTILDHAKAKSDKTELKRLLLQASDAVTPAGLQLINTTLLECVLGAGDFELAAMIVPYFAEFEGGKEELKMQLERYRPCIEAMQTQKADGELTKLINELFTIIKTSTREQVAAELATGKDYNPAFQSPLRDAFSKFRTYLLASERRLMTEPHMHCNYQNLAYVNNILDHEWDNLREGDNYDKNYLAVRQIKGFIELVELPAYERYVFARDQAGKAIDGKEIERSFDYKDQSDLRKSFPLYSEDFINSHSGVGFDTHVSIFGGEVRESGGGFSAYCVFVIKVMSSKNSKWEEIYPAATIRPSPNK